MPAFSPAHRFDTAAGVAEVHCSLRHPTAYAASAVYAQTPYQFPSIAVSTSYCSAVSFSRRHAWSHLAPPMPETRHFQFSCIFSFFRSCFQYTVFQMFVISYRSLLLVVRLSDVIFTIFRAHQRHHGSWPFSPFSTGCLPTVMPPGAAGFAVAPEHCLINTPTPRATPRALFSSCRSLLPPH